MFSLSVPEDAVLQRCGPGEVVGDEAMLAAIRQPCRAQVVSNSAVLLEFSESMGPGVRAAFDRKASRGRVNFLAALPVFSSLSRRTVARLAPACFRPWPEATPPTTVQIGISVEAGAELMGKEGRKLGAKHDFARLVATDLFRFLESFQTQQMGDMLAVPANALDRWFQRFTDKFKKDPNFLTRREESF
ncbi:hypothetical protein TSOC_008376 [Tetrabaena socialis]|uniref:Hikeshi-like C-terminal domain-containing protein n=1 Tax=Tetrabaena socialis TaxID=47790 RepID=A0A2J7ZYM5_9CHLO|nr:hypothetical protein TSOC_008376 [Tetrabaena socialis]|eukprot:PNH05369.1 hypothetical protein TSOC_008376 [Tetrabaena socialis]